MPPLVSITIAAYNIEPYLHKCMDCVVNQTLPNIEIICVNDGSTDGTLAIMQQYAARDSRIKIVDKRVNEGLGVARNDAIALATGKYVGFVDGDDLLDRDLFRKAFECAEKNRSDLVLWDYVVFWQEQDIAKKLKEPSSLLSVSPTDKIALLKRRDFAWTKLIRTKVLSSPGIVFPKGLTYQDIPVHWKLITQLDRIALLPERLSYYRQHPSATTYQNGLKRVDWVIVMDLVRNYLAETHLYTTYHDVFLWKQLESLSGLYDVVDSSLKPKAMQCVRDRLGEDQWQYILDKKPLRWQTRDFYMAMRGSVFAKVRRLIWLSARGCFRALKSIPNKRLVGL